MTLSQAVLFHYCMYNKDRVNYNDLSQAVDGTDCSPTTSIDGDSTLSPTKADDNGKSEQ